MMQGKAIAPLMLAAGLLVSPASAEEAPPSTEAVYACADIAEDSERLACYDAAVGRLKQAEQAGEITTVSRADVEAVERESFGFSLPSLPRLAFPSRDGEQEELAEVEASIDRIRSDASGKLIVYLDNGQVWRQIDTTPTPLPRGEPGIATIRRASFGSFMMKLERGRSFRVRRVE